MRRFLVAALLVPFAFPAMAATEGPFVPAAFAQAQSAGQPILVHVTAPWCPTCAKQHPIVRDYTSRPEFAGLKIYDVDFDTQKDALKSFGVRSQSTLILFRGTTELARATGTTDPAELRKLLDNVKG